MEIQYSFIGMEVSDALKEYADEKIHKHDEFLETAVSITVDFKDNLHNKGVDSDYTVYINVVLPKAIVRVEEAGPDIYAIVDKTSDVLVRRLKRYHDKKTSWDGEKPWEESEIAKEEDDNYVAYIPKVERREVLESMTPMVEGEAIERMELKGQNQMLFKNSQTGLISMIYKDKNNKYVLVEPIKEEI